MDEITFIDGTAGDSSSERWRHECEARHILMMPVENRRGMLDAIEKKRGEAARKGLEGLVFQLWIDKQARTLAGMGTDAERKRRLGEITVERYRVDVENRMFELMGRLPAEMLDERDI